MKHFLSWRMLIWVLYYTIVLYTANNTHSINKYECFLLAIWICGTWIPVELLSMPEFVFTIASMHGIAYECAQVVICVLWENSTTPNKSQTNHPDSSSIMYKLLELFYRCFAILSMFRSTQCSNVYGHLWQHIIVIFHVNEARERKKKCQEAN